MAGERRCKEGRGAERAADVAATRGGAGSRGRTRTATRTGAKEGFSLALIFGSERIHGGQKINLKEEEKHEGEGDEDEGEGDEDEKKKKKN